MIALDISNGCVKTWQLRIFETFILGAAQILAQ